jgi:pyridoxal phosphate enzyme (YggS family)
VSLQQVKQRIAGYELKYAREPGSVQLLAVSKTQAADRVRTAHSCGQRCFGENYLQEALAKMETLVDLPLEWHFIGPIQSNKTRDIASNFDWVHSVDRLKIAQRLNGVLQLLQQMGLSEHCAFGARIGMPDGYCMSDISPLLHNTPSGYLATMLIRNPTPSYS